MAKARGISTIERQLERVDGLEAECKSLRSRLSRARTLLARYRAATETLFGTLSELLDGEAKEEREKAPRRNGKALPLPAPAAQTEEALSV